MAQIITDLEKADIRAVAELPYDWQKLDGKTVLLSGGTGFIGQFIINVLKYRNEHCGNFIRVISCSRSVEPKTENGVKYVRHDITQPLAIAERADYVLHLASNTHPAQYSADPIGTITTNIAGTQNLLEFARTHGCERFLLASSVEIYGEGDGTPMTESYGGYIDCNTVRAGYNEAKRVSESLCQAYKAQYGTDVVVARLARCFGADRKNDSKAMAQFIRKAVNREDIVLKSRGTQRFSYCYVADAASGILKGLLSGQSGEAYNIADADENKTLGDYAEVISSFCGKRVKFEIQEELGASKASYAVLDCRKIYGIGWKPLYTVSNALRRTYDILSNNG